MRPINFSAESAENYEQKCLCVLVLDTSNSMNEIIDDSGAIPTGRTVVVEGKECIEVRGGSSKLDNLKDGLISFLGDIVDDETICQRLELALVTFNDSVSIVQSPKLAQQVAIPELSARGGTALVDGVKTAVDIVKSRKQWYKDTNQPYYRPWIILITDGEPNEGQDVNSLAEQIKEETRLKHYVFLPLGVDNANMTVLSQIQGTIPPMKLRGAKFSSFFNWLSASMGTIVSSVEGQAVRLQETNNWTEAFVI